MDTKVIKQRITDNLYKDVTQDELVSLIEKNKKLNNQRKNNEPPLPTTEEDIDHIWVTLYMPLENRHDLNEHLGMYNDQLILDYVNMLTDQGNEACAQLNTDQVNKVDNPFNRAKTKEDADLLNSIGYRFNKLKGAKTTWDYELENGLSPRDISVRYAIQEMINDDNPDSEKFWKNYELAEYGDRLCFTVDLANPKRTKSENPPNYTIDKTGKRNNMCYGRGIRVKNGKLEEIRTPGVTLVFEKRPVTDYRLNNNHFGTPFGLGLKTAYPDAFVRSAERTGRNLKHVLEELNVSQISNPAIREFIRAGILVGSDPKLTIEYFNGYEDAQDCNIPGHSRDSMNHFTLSCITLTRNGETIHPSLTVYENGKMFLNHAAEVHFNEIYDTFGWIARDIFRDLDGPIRYNKAMQEAKTADDIFARVQSRTYAPPPYVKSETKQKTIGGVER